MNKTNNKNTFRERFNKQPITVRAAYIAGIFALIAAIIGGSFSIVSAIIPELFREKVDSTGVYQEQSTETPNNFVPTSTMDPAKNSYLEGSCLSVSLWMPFAEVQRSYVNDHIATPIPQSDCWYLFDWGIYAENGSLRFEGADAIADGLYGIATQINLNTNIKFNLELVEMTKDDRLLVGVVNGDDLSSQMDGVYVDIWQSGASSDRFLSLNEIEAGREESYKIIASVNDFYTVELDINGARLSIYLDGELLNDQPINVVFTSPKLLIGYEKSILEGKSKILIKSLTIRN